MAVYDQKHLYHFLVRYQRVFHSINPAGCRRKFYYEHLQNGVGLDCIWVWRRPGSLCGFSGWISLSIVLDAINDAFHIP